MDTALSFSILSTQLIDYSLERCLDWERPADQGLVEATYECKKGDVLGKHHPGLGAL